MSGEKSQRQATVYGAACIDKWRAVQSAEEIAGVVVESRWTDADLAFDMGLEDWNIGFGDVPEPEVPKRLFRAWIED
jgi:hypothetical protein